MKAVYVIMAEVAGSSGKLVFVDTAFAETQDSTGASVYQPEWSRYKEGYWRVGPFYLPDDKEGEQ